MFTGLIHEIGKIEMFRMESQVVKIHILAPNITKQGVKLGDSMAINGICLTITGIKNNGFEIQAMRETVGKTTMNTWVSGMEVNIEPALTLSSHLDGHLVTGHVDGEACIKSIQIEGESKRIELETDVSIARYIAKKGSVTLDGVSLTVIDVISNVGFIVGLIPYTLNHTTLGKCAVGKKINIEVDIIARYLERLMAKEQNPTSLTIDKMVENGF